MPLGDIPPYKVSENVEILGKHGWVPEILCGTCSRALLFSERELGYINECRDCHDRRRGLGKYARGVGALHQTPLPQIGPGSSGKFVTYCQNLLNARIVAAPLWVDGLFNDQTQNKVRLFQTMSQLKPDGFVGPETWSALEAGPPPIARRPK